jgi:hypothetical protein
MQTAIIRPLCLFYSTPLKIHDKMMVVRTFFASVILITDFKIDYILFDPCSIFRKHNNYAIAKTH